MAYGNEGTIPIAEAALQSAVNPKNVVYGTKNRFFKRISLNYFVRILANDGQYLEF